MLTRNNTLPALPVSVVICARNEALLLPRLLKALAGSDYPHTLLEVVVVNDRSEDATAEILLKFQESHPDFPLKVLSIEATPAGWSPKKWAVTQGIGASRHPYLLFTDADCVMPAQWITTMMQPFHQDQDYELVLGIGLYAEENTFLNRFIRYETLLSAFVFISAALWGKAYMGVGRNIAYTKKLFEKIGGHQAHFDRLSGDDDLFVQQAQKHQAKIAVVAHPEGVTVAQPERTFKKYFRQKHRHVSAGKSYSLWGRIFLGGYYGSHGLFYSVGIYEIFWANNFGDAWLGFIILILILSIKNSMMYQAGKSWRDNTPFWTYFWCDFCHILYVAVIIPFSVMRQPVWKKTNTPTKELSKIIN